LLSEDLEDRLVNERHASKAGVDLTALYAALADGSAAAALMDAELIGRKYGVQGAPVWLLSKELSIGLRRAAEFEHFVECVAQRRR
jgi:2-hydroxychromene-2-carboxylate isomerase